MDCKRNFTIDAIISHASRYAAFALLLTSNYALSADTATRTATLLEQQQLTQHHYSNTITAGNNHSDLTRKTIRHQPLNLWLHRVDIDLHTDHDHDGHYSTFSITLDFDTSLISTVVYAVFYVSIDNRHWHEYAVSQDIGVTGAGPYDAYTIEATLDSGYPTGYYNHTVELYDAHTHEFLGSYGPNDNHYFYNLPFESYSHDHAIGLSTSLSFTINGTGAITPGSFVILLLLLGARVKRMRGNGNVADPRSIR